MSRLAAGEERRALVEAALDRALPAEGEWPATLHRAVRYSLFAGGKRLRPQLVLAASDAVGGEADAALPFACAVEMVHTYSLVHDDLPCMDDDDLRRGLPTSHRVFGEAIAVLAGDALLTRAFHLLADVPDDAPAQLARRRLRVAAILGEACGTRGLVGGQVVDLESEGRDLAAADLERLHRAKTGALLGASVRGGAVLGGADERQISALAAYASALGLAFQVVDDVLDATATREDLGKTPGKDAKAGKATYVRVFGLEGARRRSRELLAEARAALEPLGARAEGLADLAGMVVERSA